MKTRILMLISILILTTGLLSAEENTKGIGVMSFMDYSLDDDSVNETTDTTFYIKPYFATMLNEKLELNIFASVLMSVDKTDGTTTNEYSKIGLGAGVYQHVFQGRVFDFSIGGNGTILFGSDPDYHKYTEFAMSFSLPVLLDIKLSDNFLFRIEHNIASLSFTSKTYEITNGAPETIDNDFDFSTYFYGTPSIKLGLMYWF